MRLIFNTQLCAQTCVRSNLVSEVCTILLRTDFCSQMPLCPDLATSEGHIYQLQASQAFKFDLFTLFTDSGNSDSHKSSIYQVYCVQQLTHNWSHLTSNLNIDFLNQSYQMSVYGPIHNFRYLGRSDISINIHYRQWHNVIACICLCYRCRLVGVRWASGNWVMLANVL